MTRIASRKYLAASKGQTCKLRIAGVCKNDTSTVVPCHVRDAHTGRSIKASDLSVIDGCFDCHEVFDGRTKMPDGFLITGPDWLFYALRGLQETIESRAERNIIIVPRDLPKPFTDRPTKPRKPREARKPFPQRETEWPSRKISQRALRSPTK